MRKYFFKSAIVFFSLMVGTLIFSCKKERPAVVVTPAKIAVKASFTVKINSLNVSLNNTTIGGTTFSWDFGDSSTSADKSPIHTYKRDGTYRIKLKVSNSTNSDTTSQLVKVIFLKAGFTFINNGLVVTFTNTSIGASNYAWDFGDSTRSTEKAPVHTYKRFGTYHIQLVASNTNSSDTSSQFVQYETLIQIKTRLGEMIMWLYDETPKHKANFIKLADQGYFDSTTFHRVIANFVSQGGDPNSKDADTTNDGYGGPNYTIPFESNPSHGHVYGAVGAASTSAAGPSSGSQFYIVNNPSGTSFLDGNYVVFGYIIKNISVAVDMTKQPQNSINNRPYKAIRMDVNTLHMTRAEILATYGYTVK